MNISPECVRFDEDSMWVDLTDGRVIAVPLAWFPRLLHATSEQRARVELSPRGLHWGNMDEDISITGLLAGGRRINAPQAAGTRGCGDHDGEPYVWRAHARIA